MDENTKLLMDISDRLARVESTLKSMTDVGVVATQAKEIANSAHASVRSAHKRIDKIDNTLFWLSTTVIGAVIVAVLTLVFKGVN